MNTDNNIAQRLLSERFHLAHFRPGQQQVIEQLMAGHSVLAVFPTGGGKSLCYQLPALLFEGITLVVSPLIALMKDQVDYLQSLGIAAARFDSSLDKEQIKQFYNDLHQGRIDILYVAPERLSNEKFIQAIRHLSIALLAIDEAHCISDWGHNFRPDYLKLAALKHKLNIQRVLALTATATPAVSKDICKHFAIAPQHHIQTGFYRPNLSLLVKPLPEADRKAYLLSRLHSLSGQPSIIYVTLQKTAEDVAQFLLDSGLHAMAYHAGMKAEQRNEIQDEFMAGRCNIIVATIAFGMGIDKANIRAVFHYNLPKAIENYMQEIGRAGRDGLPSSCELLASSDDLTVLENFTYGDTPDEAALAGVISWILQQEQYFSLSNYQLSQQFDIRPLVLSTLLTYLELQGVIRATSPFYSLYKIKFISPQQQILSLFNAERAQFLGQLFATGKQGRLWLSITLESSQQLLQQPVQRIIAALNYLEQEKHIELQVSGLQQGYQLLNNHVDASALLQKQLSLFELREQRDIERLHQVTRWIESNSCYNQYLMQYFGDTLAQPCGHCSFCATAEVQQLSIPHDLSAIINTEHMKQVLQRYPCLTSPRQLTRFLCGISSPKLSKNKLLKEADFACYMQVPFAKVLAVAESIFVRPLE